MGERLSAKGAKKCGEGCNNVRRSAVSGSLLPLSLIVKLGFQPKRLKVLYPGKLERSPAQATSLFSAAASSFSFVTQLEGTFAELFAPVRA